MFAAQQKSKYQYQRPENNVSRGAKAGQSSCKTNFHNSPGGTKATSQGPQLHSSTLEVQKQAPVREVIPSAEVVAELNQRRRRVDPIVANLLEVLLSALCEVSSFRNLLERRHWKTSAGGRKPIKKTSGKATAELLLLDVIYTNHDNPWNKQNPLDFLVEIFENLDQLANQGEKQSAKDIFSISMSEVTYCDVSKCWIRSSLNLGALRIVEFQCFCTKIPLNERSYFNSEQSTPMEVLPVDEKNKYSSVLQRESSRKTLQQLLIDSCCLSPLNYMLCPKCKKYIQHKGVIELQSFSDGLIIILPKASWISTEVPKSLRCIDSSASYATFQLRAAVLKETKHPQNNHWVFVTKLTNLEDHFSQNSAVLFYERGEEAAADEEETLTDRNSDYPQRPKDTPALRKWECNGSNAGLKAALRGLFVVKAFTDFFTLRLSSEEQQQSAFFHHLKTLYDQHQRQIEMTESLEGLKNLLYVREGLPYEYIIKLLEECDWRVSMKSDNDLSGIDYNTAYELRDKRAGKCEVLHDIFSVLVKNKISFGIHYDNWSYTRVLDIPIISQNFTMNQPKSVIELEMCMRRLLEPKKGADQYRSQFYYFGSALIINLFDECTRRPNGKLVRIPKVLDLGKYCATATQMYHLRAIVINPESQGLNAFTVLAISDSDETNVLLQHGCRAYLLFFEQESTEPAQIKPKKSNPVSSFPQQCAVASWDVTVANESRQHRDMGRINESAGFIYGLRNLGNTCFMNAALVGLYSIEAFRAFFNKSPDTSYRSLPSAVTEFCRNFMRNEMPLEVLSQLKSAIPEFGDGKQHCANSYIFKLLIQFDQIIRKRPQRDLPKFPFREKVEQYRSGKCEPLHDIFSALVENLFICKKCFHTHQNFSYFRTVDVPIPYNVETVNDVTVFSQNNFYPGSFATVYTGKSESESLYREAFCQMAQNIPSFGVGREKKRIDLPICFQFMLRASLMSSGNLMRCTTCKKETQHYKQSFFRRLSTAFVIHFQRFDDRTGQKLDTPIDFPMNLDMSEYCVNDPRQYVLRGVVYHKGFLNFGHYTAWIREEEQWLEVNDSYVRKNSGRPPIQDVYMLFYEEGHSS